MIAKKLRVLKSKILLDTRLKKTSLLAICVIFVLLPILIGVLYINPRLSSQCAQTSKNTSNKLLIRSSKNDIKSLSRYAESSRITCDDGGIRSVSITAVDRVNQLQFYHDVAVANYMLGNTEQAKVDAQKGLNSATRIRNNSVNKDTTQQIKELSQVKRGSY